MSPTCVLTGNMLEKPRPSALCVTDEPATPAESLAASALLTLLSSPSPKSGSQKRDSVGWQPSQKRLKPDSSVAMRHAAASQVSRQSNQDKAPKQSSPKQISSQKQERLPKEKIEKPLKSLKPIQKPLKPIELQSAHPDSTRPGVAQAVSEALVGEMDLLKLAEAERWLYRQVELVRGKYKGRVALVVGMTAKKYRVRVTSVEHQLEFYPSMFKNPTPIDGLAVDVETPAASSQRPSGAPKNQSGPQSSNEGSSTASINEEVTSEGSSAGTVPVSAALGPAPKTKEQLLKLMEETSAEMRRAKDMLLGYQEVSNQFEQQSLTPRHFQECTSSPRNTTASSPWVVTSSPRAAAPTQAPVAADSLQQPLTMKPCNVAHLEADQWQDTPRPSALRPTNKSFQPALPQIGSLSVACPESSVPSTTPPPTTPAASMLAPRVETIAASPVSAVVVQSEKLDVSIQSSSGTSNLPNDANAFVEERAVPILKLPLQKPRAAVPQASPGSPPVLSA